MSTGFYDNDTLIMVADFPHPDVSDVAGGL
jgi:hypothetical protein